jgi:hypothetical protein
MSGHADVGIRVCMSGHAEVYTLMSGHCSSMIVIIVSDNSEGKGGLEACLYTTHVQTYVWTFEFMSRHSQDNYLGPLEPRSNPKAGRHVCGLQGCEHGMG